MQILIPAVSLGAVTVMSGMQILLALSKYGDVPCGACVMTFFALLTQSVIQ